MGLLGALSTSVSGLSAQSYALENISGNIANASTVGFKRVDTSFVDLIPDQPAQQELAGSVSGQSQLTNTLQGTLSSTGVGTNLALSGSGFFVVSQNNGTTSDPAFSSTNLYTRRGDFATNSEGYLVNGAGYYLSGTNIDPTTGLSSGSSTAPLKIPSTAIPAKQTTTINYEGNVPATPKLSGSSSSDLVATGVITAPVAPATASTVTSANEASFLSTTVSGGQITVYDSAGNPQNLQLRWAKTSDLSGTPAVSQWKLFYNSGTSGAAWTSDDANTDFKFDASGNLTSPTTSSVSFTDLSIAGSTVGTISLDFAGGLTGYSDTNGVVTASMDQDGYASGKPQSISISDDGSVMQTYSNGQTKKVGSIAIAQFSGADSLKRENGGAYSATTESGQPSYGLSGSTLTGGSVEGSNTDISAEFSKMIVTQQAYSANTKVMSTAQQMLQDIINLVR